MSRILACLCMMSFCLVARAAEPTTTAIIREQLTVAAHEKHIQELKTEIAAEEELVKGKRDLSLDQVANIIDGLRDTSIGSCGLKMERIGDILILRGRNADGKDGATVISFKQNANKRSRVYGRIIDEAHGDIQIHSELSSSDGNFSVLDLTLDEKGTLTKIFFNLGFPSYQHVTGGFLSGDCK